MKFLDRWFKRKEVPEAIEPCCFGKMGYGTYKGETYLDLDKYVRHLGNININTGPDHYDWWEQALFEKLESHIVHVANADKALDYIQRINYLEHQVDVPSNIRDKAYARIKLGSR